MRKSLKLSASSRLSTYTIVLSTPLLPSWRTLHLLLLDVVLTADAVESASCTSCWRCCCESACCACRARLARRGEQALSPSAPMPRWLCAKNKLVS